MSSIINQVVLPIAAGIVLFAIPGRADRLKAAIALLLSLVCTLMAVFLLLDKQIVFLPAWNLESLPATGLFNSILHKACSVSAIRMDILSKFISLAVTFYALLSAVYSWNRKPNANKPTQFYAFLLITLGSANGAVLCDHLLMFIFFWGLLGISLYKLIRGTDEEGAAAAKKSLIIVGASDSLMILGIAIVWKLTNGLSISGTHLTTDSFLTVLAFFCLLAGSFAKAGAFPLHSWIPDFTQKAPAVSSAYLPASLDKLLGIYFLSRLCLQMFVLSEWIMLIMLITGVVTILTGVMMALVQHNFKRLLGYHSVSQVGYMVLGLGLGTPLAVAGGLFHMINNSLYKSGLFLVAGNIEEATGSDEIDEAGGLSKAMPFTFTAAMIFSLAISGVPPLNGFASKWLIYQGIIEFGKGSGICSQLWLVWLGLAVLGSALTLASFIKFITGIFLGRRHEALSSVRESGFMQWFPAIFLALLCVFFGVTVNRIVLPHIIMPLYAPFDYPGVWDSSAVGWLILVSIVLGVLFYFAGFVGKFRMDDSYIGGETNQDERRVSVLDFYTTVSRAKGLSTLYSMARNKWFDMYEDLKGVVFAVSHWLSRCHTGVLPLYVFWLAGGLVILMLILL